MATLDSSIPPKVINKGNLKDFLRLCDTKGKCSFCRRCLKVPLRTVSAIGDSNDYGFCHGCYLYFRSNRTLWSSGRRTLIDFLEAIIEENLAKLSDFICFCEDVCKCNGKSETIGAFLRRKGGERSGGSGVGVCPLLHDPSKNNLSQRSYIGLDDTPADDNRQDNDILDGSLASKARYFSIFEENKAHNGLGGDNEVLGAKEGVHGIQACDSPNCKGLQYKEGGAFPCENGSKAVSNVIINHDSSGIRGNTDVIVGDLRTDNLSSGDGGPYCTRSKSSTLPRVNYNEKALSSAAGNTGSVLLREKVAAHDIEPSQGAGVAGFLRESDGRCSPTFTVESFGERELLDATVGPQVSTLVGEEATVTVGSHACRSARKKGKGKMRARRAHKRVSGRSGVGHAQFDTTIPAAPADVCEPDQEDALPLSTVVGQDEMVRVKQSLTAGLATSLKDFCIEDVDAAFTLKAIRGNSKRSTALEVAHLFSASEMQRWGEFTQDEWNLLMKLMSICFVQFDDKKVHQGKPTKENEARGRPQGKSSSAKSKQANSKPTSEQDESEKPSIVDASRIAKVKKDVMMGRLRQAIRHCSDPVRVKVSLDQMMEKFPPAVGDSGEVSSGVQLLVDGVTRNDVEDALQNFNTTSVPGKDLVGPSLLKSILNTHNLEGVDFDFYGSFTSLFFSLVQLDFVPDCLKSSMVIAHGKKDGGFRPVQIAPIFLRILTLCIARAAKRDPKLTDAISDLQVGMTDDGGTIASSVTSFLQHHGDNRDGIVVFALRVDHKNAFNAISREHLVGMVRATFPAQLADLIVSLYLDEQVWFGDKMIEASRGCKQGDSLSPLLYCLCIAPLLKKLRKVIDNTFCVHYINQIVHPVLAYLDNIDIFFAVHYKDIGSVKGTLDRVLHLFDRFNVHAGLELKPGFTHVRVLNVGRVVNENGALVAVESAPVYRDMKTMISELSGYKGLKDVWLSTMEEVDDFMGLPIGPENLVREHLFKKIDGILEEARETARVMQFLPHEFLLILRKCYGTKLMHLARSLPTDFMFPILQFLDLGLCEIFCRVIELPFARCFVDGEESLFGEVSLDAVRQSLLNTQSLPEGLRLSFQGSMMLLSAKEGGVEVSSSSTRAMGLRIGMFVNICARFSPHCNVIKRYLIDCFGRVDLREVDDKRNGRDFACPLAITKMTLCSSNDFSPNDLPSFILDLFLSMHRLRIRHQFVVTNGEGFEEAISDSRVRESAATAEKFVSNKLARINFLLPTESNGAFPLRKNKGSKSVNEFIFKCMNGALSRHEGVSKKCILFLAECSMKGIRDLLVTTPTFSTVIKPTLFKLYMAMKLDYSVNYGPYCNGCGEPCDVYHYATCTDNRCIGFRTNCHQQILEAFMKILESHPGFRVTLNGHAKNAKARLEGGREGDLVSDCKAVGQFRGKRATMQFDITHTNVFCASAGQSSEDLSTPNDLRFHPTPHVPLLKRNAKKIEKYKRWKEEGEIFVPIVLSAHGAIATDTVRFLYDIAAEFINVQTDIGYNQLPHYGWKVPYEHILVGLLFQRFRARLSHAALTTTLSSAYSLIKPRGRF
ncbi:MAG: reverse transcriptase domain-containing protein [Euryarchaeota archaeon]|nr:reverse transcriptase domain-containing protein [Euryarchaeota archaeon]